MVDYRRERGHFIISPTHPELYRWVTRQRRAWQLGSLDYPLEQELRRLGFPFEREDCEWEQRFAPILGYCRRSGRLPRPGSRYREWVEAQRAMLRARTLRPDRADRLKDIFAIPTAERSPSGRGG